MDAEKLLELHLDKYEFEQEKSFLSTLASTFKFEKMKLSFQLKEHKLQKIMNKTSFSSRDKEGEELASEIKNLIKYAEEVKNENQELKRKIGLCSEAMAKQQKGISVLKQRYDELKQKSSSALVKLKQALKLKLSQLESASLKIRSLKEEISHLKLENEKIKNYKEEIVVHKRHWEGLKNNIEGIELEGSMAVFGQEKFRKKIIGYLDQRSVFELRRVNRYLRWTISLDFKLHFGYFQQKMEKMAEEIKEYEDTHDHFENSKVMVHGDYLAFLVWKIFKKKKKPGNYINGTLIRAQQMVEQIKESKYDDFKMVEDDKEKFEENLKNADLEFENTKESIDFIIEQLKIDISPPMEIIELRNDFFGRTKDQIKENIEKFKQETKDLGILGLRSVINQLFPLFTELFFMSRMLFQEAKEIDSFKDWLIHNLLKALMKNSQLQGEIDNYRQEREASSSVKDMLMKRTSSLERQVHDLIHKLSTLNQSIKKHEKFSKESYKRQSELEEQCRVFKEEAASKEERIETLEKSLTDYSTVRKRFIRIGNILQEYLPDTS